MPDFAKMKRSLLKRNIKTEKGKYYGPTLACRCSIWSLMSAIRGETTMVTCPSRWLRMAAGSWYTSDFPLPDIIMRRWLDEQINFRQSCEAGNRKRRKKITSRSRNYELRLRDPGYDPSEIIKDFWRNVIEKKNKVAEECENRYFFYFFKLNFFVLSLF